VAFVVACFLTFQKRSDGVLLALRGEVDLSNVGYLRDALDWAFADDTGNIEIDLCGVTFLDCATIGVLVTASQIAQQSGRELFISNPQGFVRTMFELTGDLAQLSASDPVSLGRSEGSATETTSA
jgi:anti-sigma B factor antagonist